MSKKVESWRKYSFSFWFDLIYFYLWGACNSDSKTSSHSSADDINKAIIKDFVDKILRATRVLDEPEAKLLAQYALDEDKNIDYCIKEAFGPNDLRLDPKCGRVLLKDIKRWLEKVDQKSEDELKRELDDNFKKRGRYRNSTFRLK